MSAHSYSTETLDRIRKLERIRALGVNPFATKFDVTHQIGSISREYPTKIEEGQSSVFRAVEDIIPSPVSTVSISGRVMLHRSFGKICFATLSDGTGRIQILFSRENCQINVNNNNHAELVSSPSAEDPEINSGGQQEPVSAYKFAEKLIDLGDFIGVKGELFYTHKGELTLFVSEFTFLTKAIRPLPEKFHGMENDDERYRKRYLDIAMDDELRSIFLRKSAFWKATRDFLLNKGFLEVDTPTLEHTTGGAEARPFATHHNDYDVDVYLRISIGELWQKRLMAAGFPKTFEIGRAFRNEGSSPDHLQEFTNMEFYWAYADYEMGMSLVEEMYRYIAKTVYGKTVFSARGHTFDLADEWRRVDYVSAVREKTGIDILTATDDEMKNKLTELGVKYDGTNRERLTDTLWKYTRKQIAGPAFLVNHPELISPLAKGSTKNPGTVERFQVILGGSEIGNGYSELNDPLDQRTRFEKQQSMLASGDDEAMMPDWDFVEMLEHGMPPTCGFGFGERLFSFLENKPIREVQYFPFMKPVHVAEEKETKETKVAVALINQGANLSLWQISNTVGHLAAAFGARTGKSLFFTDTISSADKENIFLNIQHAIMIKSGTKDADLKDLLKKARELDIHTAEFTREMLETTNDKVVIEKTQGKEYTDIEHLGVLLFGNKKVLESLTEDFPLFQ